MAPLAQGRPSQAQYGLGGLLSGLSAGLQHQQEARQKDAYARALLGQKFEQSKALQEMKNEAPPKQKPPKQIPTGTNIRDLAQFPVDIENLQGLDEKVEKNQDVLGPWAGRLATLGQYVPSKVAGIPLQPEGFERAREIQADVDNLKQTIGKLKEGGVLRQEDENKYKKILATINDEPKLASYKIRSILDEMSDKYNKTISALGSQGYDVSGLRPLVLRGRSAPSAPPAPLNQGAAAKHLSRIDALAGGQP